MKKIFLLIFFLLTLNGFAQQKLTKSIRNSRYTYFYKISDDDLLNLYLHPEKKPTDDVLKQKVDSVLTKYAFRYQPKLTPGNYVKVYANENSLMFDLIENRTASMQLITQNKHIEFLLTGRDGTIVTDAIVTNNGKNVGYDKNNGFYTFSPARQNIVKVTYKGVSNFFRLGKTQPKKPFFLSRWFKKLFAKKPEQNYYRYNDQANYPGFVVLNKPKYKPRDTVRIKAFIADIKTNKPLKNKQVLVRLSDEYGNNDFKTLATINSYRPGMYEYSFVLTDSLDLDLDDTYRVILTDTKKLQKKNNNKNDDDDDDEEEEDLEDSEKNYLQLVSSKFEYEEYELKAINFNIRTDKDSHQTGDTLNVYLKATDENGLPVPDGRVDLLVKTNYVNNYKASHVFVPDSLWTHTVQLDPLGETKVTLPDSIFPKASFSYQIQADFLNLSNEHRNQWKYIEYKANNYRINTKISGDTLKIDSYIRGKKQPLKAMLYAISNNDTLNKQTLTLPAQVLINPNVSNYSIVADSAHAEFNLSSEDSGVSITGERTAESAKVNVKSKRKLHFWYSIYLDNKLIERGEADSLNYNKRIRSKGNITVFAYYMWAGRLRNYSQTYANYDGSIKINVQQPMTIYPGQKVTTELTVTDNDGKPVADADITAWSLTSKFEGYNAPSVPYFGTFGKVPNMNILYSNLPLNNSQNILLNWKRWSRDMGLDSIEYYKFTHPDTIYTITEHVPDTITQIAPFVVHKGDIIPVHIVYIDNIPVYFSQTQDLSRYSFRVDSGMHDIRMRTSKMEIEVKDVIIAHHKKTIFSINADSTLKRFDISIKKAPDTLTNDEKRTLNNHLISIENTFKMQMATLQQGERLYLLNAAIAGSDRQSILTGPVAPNLGTYSLKGGIEQNFIAETGYNYTFLPGLLKQKSFDGYPFNKQLNYGKPVTDYTQLAITPAAADTLWQNYLDRRSQNSDLFQNNYIWGTNTGRLTIRLQAEDKHFVKNILIYKNNDTEFLQIYRGAERNFGNLEAGKYRLMFLLKDDEYAIQENIIIKPNGSNYYNIAMKPHARDSVSIKINRVIQQRNDMYDYGDRNINNDKLTIKESFNEKYLDNSGFTKVVTGTVLSADDKLPIPGVSVVVKGTKYGTQTDAKGNFKLKVPETGKILVAFVGYVTEEFTIKPGDNYVITLNASSSQLNEVVVVGYGTRSKKELSASMVSDVRQEVSAALAGRVAGVSVANSEANVIIRGMSSPNIEKRPIVVVDGNVITEAEFKSMNPDDIGNIDVLKDAAATALYGARAANGVIIITTKKKQAADEAEANLVAQNGGNSLRKNFNDYAYWQPRLTTDANGKARFTTAFPDDITNWRTFFIGISNKMETAITEGNIKAYKPVSAAMIAPQFAVEGDKMSIIGKVMNYNSTPVKLQRTFIYNGTPQKQDSLSVSNSKIDTLAITAAATDSLTFEYAIKRNNGYSDGEQRKIPVVKQGVQETKGLFEVLRQDTTMSIKFEAALGKVTFRAEASALPALIEETDKLREYRYLCNEQLASKLKGLISEKRIKGYLKQPFAHEKNIIDIIKKLNENRKGSGLWGWWKESDEEIWISRHVIEALLDAQKEGYATNFDKQKITQYLIYQLERYNGYDKINAIELLLKLEAKADYKKYIAAAQKEQSALKYPSVYNKYRLMLIQQKAGLTANIDDLLSSKKSTMFGNIYWGENNSYRFFDNSVQLSVLAYQIIKNSGKQSQLLDRITGYLLEQRREGGWRNTYESSLILETILPDLMKGRDGLTQPQLILTGGKNETVTTFPYSATFDSQTLGISKKGTLPVYITGYQQYWNSKPEKISKDFTVNTWFENNGDKTMRLKGGKKVKLIADVTARADGEFVMIEIPIPAGCSYESKEQSWRNNEIHREYFKEKVSIFCRKLKQGQYKFEVELMPRYDGEYTLNPAKAELMYFPVFYGREGLKKVSIGGN
ncbi:carboxypeptidase-like regulatory domain-containing protein [Mucilaginibacter sp. UR6-1]|uniref:carboxypeptidase-like regulatory domain-containing protein n=1 Tax=Mucilaginibacter sp. UR6-1 TaxID=1435643 RepID=UPI001E5BA020|nr:carboxypeptidase-like regulatory domain-containing protein [Mucilaginibacter sp. UR6-1]MCC8407322.1 carboxypeptidase-like regulatory domain-containing protein [Mucilaginibacter sp. UR6-1]